MKVYINKNSKLVINNKESSIKLTKELYDKIKNQTSSTYLIEKDGDLVFNNSLDKVIKELRLIRDKKLLESDFYFLSDTTKLTDTTLKSELKVKRQLLRDITNDIKTVDDALSAIAIVKNIY